MPQDQLFSLIDERQRRPVAVEYATHSVELSCPNIDLSTQKRVRLCVEGELSWQEFCDLQR